MRTPLLLAALLVTVMLPLPVQAQSGGVVVSELYPDPASGDREFVELWNSGGNPVELAGWTVADEAGNTFTFGNHTLPAGGRIVVWGGGSDDARGPAWSRASAWNNGGDQAFLRDATGADVDVLAYGSSTWPDGRNATVPAAPATGDSLSRHDGAWIHAQPTPGTVAPDQGGSVSATVQDVPPEVSIDAPGEMEPAVPTTVRLGVHDPNGDVSIAAWRLLGDGALLHNGTAGGDHDVLLTPPSDRDRWTLRLEATDAGGQQGDASVTVTVSARGLVVVVPAGGIPFPGFPPGADEVLANATFTLRNDAEQAVSPRIDVSDLAGPTTIPVVDHLSMRYGNSTWTAYDGPLTRLPAIPAGTSVQVQLRLTDLPAPLPAGTYGTSFSVIA